MGAFTWMIAAISLGSWINNIPGTSLEIEILQPDQVRFRFIGDRPWTLKLLPRRVFRIAYLMDPRFVWRGLGMFTSMRLYR